MSREQRDQSIWAQVLAIPPGCVASYGQIAEQAGIARGARQVSPAMGRAPKSMKLPWYRVIGASGKIAIPKTSTGHQRQIDLLRDEGVIVNNSKIDLKQFAWQPSIDELLWGDPQRSLQK
ncbi:MAG: cysteine methyltransferase [Gammaproteobacteria bacterium]|nr:cysteine methyltransferase [Gammaproteobacteria bacterium]